MYHIIPTDDLATTKLRHNKIVYIFDGIYCISMIKMKKLLYLECVDILAEGHQNYPDSFKCILVYENTW